MATLVFFHAHPDDESIITAGTIALASQAGHRTVLVVATAGEEGEVDDGFLAPGVSLGETRIEELGASAAILGVDRIELLGYRDSGMMGTDSNTHPDSFWHADAERAARQVAAILIEEAADVLTVYDDNGGYGHPDHIQVHRVGRRAAELADTPRVFEATIERELSVAAMASDDAGDLPELDAEFGKPAAEISVAVDVSGVIDLKKAAMRAHQSQISEQSFFLAMDDDRYLVFFGTEWYIQVHPEAEGTFPQDRVDTLI